MVDTEPDAISSERPDEADGELEQAVISGPVENDAAIDGGGEGGPVVEPPSAPPVEPAPTPRPAVPEPEQERLTIRRARFDASRSGCRSLAIPPAVEQALGASTVRIRVRTVVAPDGTVMSATVVRGNESVPESLILRCAEQWVFEPATLPDGTAVPYPAIRVLTITPRT